MLPIQSYLRSIADPRNATVSSRFFKTGIGEYGEGDVFLGIPVGDTRKAVQSYISESSFETVEILL